MKYFLTFPLLFSALVSSGNYKSLQELRILYYKAEADKQSAARFVEVMEEINTGVNPLMLCYKGMAYLLQARQSINPYNKLYQFRRGRSLIEQAVHDDPENVEIHFMRYCVQTNSPSFIGYNKDINDDRKFVLKSMHKVADEDLKKRINDYLFIFRYGKDENKAAMQISNKSCKI